MNRRVLFVGGPKCGGTLAMDWKEPPFVLRFPTASIKTPTPTVASATPDLSPMLCHEYLHASTRSDGYLGRDLTFVYQYWGVR